jgi:hypothetical protein
VILVMLAILALAHGALVAALSERSASHAAVRELEARAAADVGMWRALRHPAGGWMDSVKPGTELALGTSNVGSVTVGASLLRLGPESWLALGSVRRPSGVAARTGRMAWSLDPVERVVALGAVVSVVDGSAVLLGGTVDGSAPAAVLPPLREEDCEPWIEAIRNRYGAGGLPPVALLADGGVEPRLGMSGFEELLAAAAIRVSGVGTPSPVELMGLCRETDPWSWGDPERPWRPCGTHLAFRGAEDDLYVEGGVGQGVLVVDGDVTFAAGARHYGLVLARGMLRLEGGAALEGMAIAGGGLVMEVGTSLRGSACWAVRALVAQRARLSGLVQLENVGRIGPL